MIPKFPEFKRLELSDRVAVEAFTKRFAPYSDFNFVSMWSWDIHGDVRISQLNDNLIVRFNDYLTGEPFYSFFGNTKVDESVERLLAACLALGVSPKLRLVPEESVAGLDRQKFLIEEERDHFDYIVRLADIEAYGHPKTKNRRRAVKGFLNAFSPTVRVLDITDIENQNKVLQLFIKKSVQDNKVTKNEFLAVLRFMRGHKETGVLILGAFLDSEFIGFCFDEIVGRSFANFHFWRADTKISRSTYDYLLQENAKHLRELGCEYLNMEQDLGIENLRSWKSSLGDYYFLKKYTVSLLSQKTDVIQ